MVLNTKKIDYAFIKLDDKGIEEEEQGYFIVTYNNEEFCVLAQKLNIVMDFEKIVNKNNGELIGEEDIFKYEEDIKVAVIELQLLFDNIEYQKNVFEKFLNEYIESNKDIESLNKYLFMLDKDSIEKILSK